MCESETSERRCERDQSSLVWVSKLENFSSIANMKQISHHHHDVKETTSVNQVDSYKANHSDLYCLPYQSTPSKRDQVQFCKKLGTRNNKLQATHVQKAKLIRTSMNTKSWHWRENLLNLIIINTILSQLDDKILNYITSPIEYQLNYRVARGPPRILFADAIECSSDGDCGNREKICHEYKCICTRDRPIDSPDGCLTHSSLGDPCIVNEQCLGNSLCIDGTCSCGIDEISLFNPSSKLFYCHPKRRLNEECNYDSQCPTNSYCSTSKFGCLCQNGYSPTTISSGGIESLECSEKSCSNSSSCESEYHQCDDNKCKCLATHFDPTTAKCYKFGSTGGKASDELLSTSNNSISGHDQDGNDNFHSILKDLTENSDRMWLVLIVLISSSIILLVLIFLLIRKYSLGYCWTAHKKVYEPNNNTQAKNGYFNKNSINNKSFRQKNGETEDADLVDDKNDSIAFAKSADKNHYVKVNVNDDHHNDDSFNGDQNLYDTICPLKTSTSTPV